MNNSSEYITKLRALSDAHAEDIFYLSDTEVDAELKTCAPDADAIIQRLQQSLDERILRARRGQLATSKNGLIAARSRASIVTSTGSAQLKAIADKLFSSFQSQLPTGLTVAYREGKYTSEEDLISLLEDLRDLGFDTNNKKL